MGGDGQKFFLPKIFFDQIFFLPIYIKFLIVRSFVRSSVSASVTFLTATSNVNNSVIFNCRTVPREANERYCYIFFIFGVRWGKGVRGGPLGGTKKNEKLRKSPKNEKLRRS